MGRVAIPVRQQNPVARASVLLVGAGAPGLAAAVHLAVAGVGGLTFWDSSLLTPHDLSGGFGRDAAQVGLPRARAAASIVRSIAPGAVTVLDRESDLVSAVPEHDLVIASGCGLEALAGPASRAGIWCVLYSAHGGGGSVVTLGPGKAAPTWLLPSDGGVGAPWTAAGIVGALAATEALRVLESPPHIAVGRVLTFDSEQTSLVTDVF